MLNIYLFYTYFKPIFLGILAKRYLGIPASQASCERIFSISKNDITESRTSIKPELAENLLMLRKRREILEQCDAK